MKKCIECQTMKPVGDFHKDKSRADGLSNRCKSCRCKYEEVIQKNCVACGDMFSVSGKAKAQKYCGRVCQRVHIRFGIDEYKLEDLLLRSDYKCAICGNPETNIDKRTGKVYELCIDHDHQTGEVRGVLCCSCNAAIGYFKDNIEIMQKATEYLQASQKCVLN